MTTIGSIATAMAMQARCFMPPESSCGKRRPTARSRPTDSSELRALSRSAFCDMRFLAWSSRVSMIWSSMRITGFSEFIAPWGIMLIWLDRTSRISRSESFTRSTPLSRS